MKCKQFLRAKLGSDIKIESNLAEIYKNTKFRGIILIMEFHDVPITILGVYFGVSSVYKKIMIINFLRAAHYGVLVTKPMNWLF